MQNIRTYFQNQIENSTPNEKDFEMLLSKIQVKQKLVPVTKRSPFMLWSFASVSFAAVVLLVVSVVNPNAAVNTNNRLAVNNSNEAINTIDSVKSFNIQNDNDF